jgi:hypothetical protein
MDRNDLPVVPRKLGVPSGVSKMIFESMEHLTHTVHLSCTDTDTLSKRKEMRFHRTHVTEEFYRVRPKWISKPMVRLAQIMHLSCTNTNTVSKQTKTRFQMTHVTYEFHRVRSKWFPSLWYIQRKLCIYLASTLGLSPNRTKRASSWAS